jgi:hypothetical protein
VCLFVYRPLFSLSLMTHRKNIHKHTHAGENKKRRRAKRISREELRRRIRSVFVCPRSVSLEYRFILLQQTPHGAAPIISSLPLHRPLFLSVQKKKKRQPKDLIYIKVSIGRLEKRALYNARVYVPIIRWGLSSCWLRLV